VRSFLVRVNERLFRIFPLESFPCGNEDYIPVDCKDSRTRYESQAIMEAAQTPEAVIADSQVRDAIRSAYYNATAHESGHYPAGGTHLPDDFEVRLIG
jgi:hypothetical protein